MAPFRAGRSLDGAIDDLIEQMKMKGEAPPKDDPQTATAKVAKEIEQMKIDRQKERDKADTALKAAEIKQRDAEGKAKIESQERIELARLNAKRNEEDVKGQQLNQKAIHDREAHQGDMIKKDAEVQAVRAKAEAAERMAMVKANEQAAKSADARAMAQIKMAQPRGDGGGSFLP